MIRDPEQLQEMLSHISRLVTDVLIPCEDQVDRDRVIPEDVVDQLRAIGLGGLGIPEQFGGTDLTAEEVSHVAIAFNRAAPAYYRRLSTNDGLGFALTETGSDAQKQAWLPKLASGAVTASFALTEPEAGSDAGALKTTAIKEGSSYLLNGGKRFITNAPYADVFLVMARTDPDDRGPGGISAFLVEADRDGLVCGPADDKMGLHGNDTGDVLFNDCRIPVDNLIGSEGDGFRIAKQWLGRVRLEAAATAVGNAERLIDEMIHYARDRKQFGSALAEFQLVQAMLADSQAEVYAARAMVLDCARRLDAGEQAAVETASCKLFATEMVGRVADRAVQIHGGSGYMRSTSVERFYRDVRIYRIYDGSNQIQQLIIAKNLIRDGHLKS